MEKYIFKKFTIENKILLTPDSMTYMVERIKDKEDVDEILTKYKTHNETSKIDIQKIKLIIDSLYVKEEIKIDIKSWKYVSSTRTDRYNFLKSLIKEDLKLIDDIDVSEKATIFGVIYNNKHNKLIVEDESGCMELEFNEVDCFIADFIFLILHGTKIKTTFLVDKIDYPPIQTMNHTIKDESMMYTKRLLFFYVQIKDDIEINETEVFLINPENKTIRNRALEKGFRIIEKDEYSLNNPVYVQINNKSILLYQTDFFRNKEKGYFLGNKYVKSLISTYISQYDLSPFSVPHMYVDVIPDAFVIFQDSYSFIEKCDNTQFISIATFDSSHIYLEYDPSIDMFILKKN